MTTIFIRENGQLVHAQYLTRRETNQLVESAKTGDYRLPITVENPGQMHFDWGTK